MKHLIKNPFTIWLVKLIKSKITEYKNRGLSLKIGILSHVTNCIFGKYNTIYNNVTLSNVILDDFTYIASGTKIARASIGKFCSIGQDCKIGLGKHPSDTFISTHPIFFSNLRQAQISFADRKYFNEFENITIGNDVWIGTNTIIIDGVIISDGVIVAAGSVVTKDIPPYAIVGGIPAKIIKYRFKQEDIKKLLNSQWWNKDIKFLKENYKKFHNIKNIDSILG